MAKIARKQLMHQNKLSFSTYDNVTLLPATQNATNSLRINIGAYRADHQPLEDVALVRNYGKSAMPAYREATSWLDHHTAYGGFLDYHFGHFLLESLARGWFLKQSDAEKSVWLSLRPELSIWQKEIFELILEAVLKNSRSFVSE